MQLPKARTEHLIVHEFPEEVVIYDLERNKAFCLNRTAGFVWKRCDGRTSVTQIARRLGAEMKVEVDEALIRLALNQLSKDNLLENQTYYPSGPKRISRRQAVRAIGAAAILAPVVVSIVAPTAAQAATCLPEGQPCVFDGDCCSFNCNVGACGPPL